MKEEEKRENGQYGNNGEMFAQMTNANSKEHCSKTRFRKTLWQSKKTLWQSGNQRGHSTGVTALEHIVQKLASKDTF